jgi:hypothetical protein
MTWFPKEPSCADKIIKPGCSRIPVFVAKNTPVTYNCHMKYIWLCYDAGRKRRGALPKNQAVIKSGDKLEG